MLTIALFAALVVASIGALILWSNPARLVNRAVGLNSLFIASWLVCMHLTATAASDRLAWMRWACAAGALIPVGFWAVKESIVRGEENHPARVMMRRWGWLAIATIALVVVPFTDAFIPSHSTPTLRIFGWGYYAYMWVLLGVYCFMFLTAFRAGRRLSGARRLELQIWLGGGCAMILSVLATMALNAMTKERIFIQIQPLLVLASYGAIAVAITMRRIFDARQILLLVAEKVLLVVIVSLTAYLLVQMFGLFLPESLALVATVAVSLWFATVLITWLDRMFRFYPRATVARQAAFAASRRESKTEGLEKAFIDVLKGWGQAEHAVVISGGKGGLRGQGIQLSEESAMVQNLRELRWVTPERLARERSSPSRREIAAFLTEHQLGALVIGEGRTLTVMAGVGVAAARRPFTYPQVTQLMELASIMESALERAHYSVKAQHAEQLATVGLLGASLAHEIRNPLVTIKTFVQLLPKHHHDPIFRQKFFGLIGDEVTRIDRLTEQLLDLASPRVYRAEAVELHPVLRSSLELVAAKATDKRIEFLTEFQATADRAFTDASAVKQVLLNLCFNAIQAVEAHTGDRWIKISTRNVPKGLEMIVEDSGPGISPAIRPRLFQPFQSTKSSGFGLGLAICSDILAGLDATISVDPSVPGRGALFRIVFPCPA